MVNSNGYNVRYRKLGTSTWSNASCGTNSLYITGLTKNTQYEFQVENICAPTYTNSGFSPLYVFKTSKTVNPKASAFEEAALPASLTVHPNPVNGQMTIYYTLAEAGTATVRIVNTLGVEMLRHDTPYSLETGLYSLPYDASRFVPGVYFVIVSTDRTIETTKFIIQR
jgi:hypothetical protein